MRRSSSWLILGSEFLSHIAIRDRGQWHMDCFTCNISIWAHNPSVSITWTALSIVSHSYDWCWPDNKGTQVRVSTLPLLGNLNSPDEVRHANSNACVVALVCLPDKLLAVSLDSRLPSIQSPVMFPGLSILLALRDRI